MNGIRQKARATFDEQQQWRAEHTLQCIEMTQATTSEETIVKPPVLISCGATAPPDGCLQRLSNWLYTGAVQGNHAPTSGKDAADIQPHASVKIVMIEHTQSESDENLLLGIHHLTFSDLFRELQLDDYLLYLLLRNVDGLYSAKDASRTLGTRNASRSESFYLNIRGFYTVLWTSEYEFVDVPTKSCQLEPHHIPCNNQEKSQNGANSPGQFSDTFSTMETYSTNSKQVDSIARSQETFTRSNAIILCRPDLMKDLQEDLAVYKELASHPNMLLLACAGRLLHEIDTALFRELRAICDTEVKTGFSTNNYPPFGLSPPRPRRGRPDSTEFREDELGYLSASMSSTSANLALYSKLLTTVKRITPIKKDVYWQRLGWPIADEVWINVSETSNMLHLSSLMTVDYVAYLAKRAEIQHTVVSISKQFPTRSKMIASYYPLLRFYAFANFHKKSYPTLSQRKMPLQPSRLLRTPKFLL